MTDAADAAAGPRLPFDFHSSPGYWVFLARDAYLRAVDGRLAPHGITYRQWLALAWLVRDGGSLTQAELARRLDVEPPTVVGLVDRLERRGWAVREGDPADGRLRRVRLGPAAEAAWDTVAAALLAVRAEATKRLTPEQVRELIAGLRAMAEAAAEPPAAADRACSGVSLAPRPKALRRAARDG